MEEQQAFIYLKSMVEMTKISGELNPDGVSKDAEVMIDAIDILLHKLNKLESENAILKAKNSEVKNEK